MGLLFKPPTVMPTYSPTIARKALNVSDHRATDGKIRVEWGEVAPVPKDHGFRNGVAGGVTVLVALIVAGVYFACNAAPQPVAVDPRPGLKAVGPLIAATSTEIGGEADTIDNAGERYTARLAPAEAFVWRPYKAVINAATARQRVDVGKLQTAPPTIAQAVQQTDVIVAASAAKDVTIGKLNGRIGDLERQDHKALHFFLGVLIAVGAVATAAGIVAMVEGNFVVGPALAVGGIALGSVSFLFLDHPAILMMIGAGLALAAGAYFVFKHADLSKGLTAAQAAEAKLKLIGADLVQWGENLKQDVAYHLPTFIAKWFGSGVTGGVSGHTQQAATQAFVAQVRASGAVTLANTTNPTPIPSVTTVAGVSVASAPAVAASVPPVTAPVGA